MDRKWWVLLSIGIASFMAALDASVVNIILPVIQSEFVCNVAAVEWTVSLYPLAISALLLLFGRLGDLWGHRPIYVSGFWLFVIGSALCGLSPGVATLIAFRCFQAIGAAMVFASAPALLTSHFPANQRGQALGMQATMTYLGLAVGPALGGWLTHVTSWRAVFYINVPVGALALAAGMFFIPKSTRQDSVERFDFVGAALFMAGLVALLFGLNRGHDWGWASWQVLSLSAASAALLASFVAVEMHTVHPMLDLSLFRQPIFSASVIAAVMNYVCMSTIGFLMPFYLIQGRGLDMRHAGILLTFQPLAMAVAAPISGTISDRVRSNLPSTIGMAILAVGTLLLSLVGEDTSLVKVAAAFIVTGLGTGIFISPNNSALMGSAPSNRQGIAAGMLATSRNFGMVLGIGLAGAVFTTALANHRPVTDGIVSGLHVATIAAVLGGLVSLARPKREEATDKNGAGTAEHN
jgi:EmrB/QacA subfamily drug resistance transporter